jgi:hypothetical protein
MARLLDTAELQAPADRGGIGRYENATNGYQEALLAAYRRWGKDLLKGMSADMDANSEAIDKALPDLQRALQAVAQEQLPTALDTLRNDYVPSADAYNLIADAITQAASDIGTRLVPDVGEKLQRGLAESADLAGVLQSLEPRVGGYAGAMWVLIMRAIGDFAMQGSLDNIIYRIKWRLDPQVQHCEACPIYAKEYDSYDAMLIETGGSVPGYFAGSPYKACWGNCRCHLELKIDGDWKRV